jgi:predicted ATPase
MISRIRIKNFKSIKETEINPDAVNIIIGSNNSGKSNLLEALEYYSRSLTVPLSELFGPRPFSFPDVFHKGSDIKTEGLEIDLAFRKFTENTKISDKESEVTHSYRIDSVYNSKGYPKFIPVVKYEEIISQYYNKIVENQDQVLMRELGQKRELKPEFIDMYYACRAIRKFQFVPKEIKKEREIDPLESNVPFLKYNGENLVNVLFTMRDRDPEAFRIITDDFKDIFPDVTGFSFTHLGDYRYAIEFTRKINGSSWDFMSPQISDGFVISLAILTLIHMNNSNRIVLIEEIENGLNPITLGKILNKIIFNSKRYGTQFFITTHSPVILDSLSDFPELILVCEQKNGKSEYIPLTEKLNIFRGDYIPGESLVELWLEGMIGGL